MKEKWIKTAIPRLFASTLLAFVFAVFFNYFQHDIVDLIISQSNVTSLNGYRGEDIFMSKIKLFTIIFVYFQFIFLFKMTTESNAGLLFYHVAGCYSLIAGAMIFLTLVPYSGYYLPDFIKQFFIGSSVFGYTLLTLLFNY